MDGTAVRVFISYSREDKDLCEELSSHLASLENCGDITTWYDGRLEPGDEWREKIEVSLSEADIILLLVSAKFLASEFCYKIELPVAMQRHEDGTAIVIPILLRPCYWEIHPFAKLQILPEGARAVTRWPAPDEAYEQITRTIGKTVQKLQQKRQLRQPGDVKPPTQPAPPTPQKPLAVEGHFTEQLGNGVVLEMIKVPAGQFWMGSPDNEAERSNHEGPQHWVSVSEFRMGKYPVTQAQWSQVAALPKVEQDLKPFPSHFKGDKLPVEQVNWYEAVEFCQRLSQKTGRNYRLPSEAEWEYACRAGTTTPFYFGETLSIDQANYNGDYTYGNGPKGAYREKTTDVGSFPPNAFGLYDMHGNVWEWCADHWHDSYEDAPTDGSPWIEGGNSKLLAVRGGSWYYNLGLCRSAFRARYEPVNFDYTLGFRVCCTASLKQATALRAL
jgi:formylglycine-generating enzyme required for sulfatase activity